MNTAQSATISEMFSIQLTAFDFLLIKYLCLPMGNFLYQVLIRNYCKSKNSKSNQDADIGRAAAMPGTSIFFVVATQGNVYPQIKVIDKFFVYCYKSVKSFVNKCAEGFGCDHR